MGQFDDFMGASFNEAADVFGMVRFTLLDVEYCGVLNEHQTSKETEIEGSSYIIEATIVADLDQFGRQARGRLERDVVGKNLVCQARNYRVETASVDTVTITLSLSTQSANR